LKYSLDHIAVITKGILLASDSGGTIEHILLDSRRLIFPETSLFFALRGPKRNGLEFMEELFRRGVRHFVVDRRFDPAGMPGAGIILVEDSLRALQDLAAFHRAQFELPVIGITGSNGKTIVKEWLNQLLEEDFRVVRSPRSYNSQIGVPLSVWQIEAGHELGIFEAGISEKGEMERLARVIRPAIGIFTNIGETHSEGFQDRTEKLQEKLRLFEGARVLIYCADQEEPALALSSRRAVSPSPAPDPEKRFPELFSWGRNRQAKLRLMSVGRERGGSKLLVSYEAEEYALWIPFTDDASLENSMHCIALLFYLGLKPEEFAGRLARLTPLAMRLELKSGINNCSVINDSYSADPISLRIALDFLYQQHQHPRRTVILSDFFQTGREESSLYSELAGLLGEKKPDRLIAIGERLSIFRDLMGKSGIGEILTYPSTESFLQDMHRLSFRNETILLKGARVFQFEAIDRRLSNQAHQTVLEISLSAMANNLRQYQGLLTPATKLMAMVKAFGYGSGSYEIANLLQFHKVDYLAVAYTDEGVDLRKAGIRLPIMVMSPEESSYAALVEYNLEPVIYSFRVLQGLDSVLRQQGIREMPVHIEMETGMHRLGFPTPDIPGLAEALSSSFCRVQSIFSHLAASADPQQDAFSARQFSLFLESAGMLSDALGYPLLRHISNTAAITRHPDWKLDMVRLGIGLYGIESGDTKQLDLQEVSTLRSTIAQIRTVKEGETVGYDREGWVSKDTVVATVRLGYADGYPRSLGNGAGKMWLKGKLVPTIGSICMDMTMVDITGIPDVEENAEITVFGGELPVREVAHWARTIPYEILTGVSQRVKRIYFEE
jgi:alanine racemase